jgi:hypothetical protein
MPTKSVGSHKGEGDLVHHFFPALNPHPPDVSYTWALTPTISVSCRQGKHRPYQWEAGADVKDTAEGVSSLMGTHGIDNSKVFSSSSREAMTAQKETAGQAFTAS